MNKTKKESLKQINEFLENYDYEIDDNTNNLKTILKTQNQLIYSKDTVNISMSESQGLDKNNNLSYQLSINVNGVVVWNSEIKEESFKVSVVNKDVFVINEEVICLPFDYLCMSAVANYPISSLKNALDAEKEINDVDDLILDKESIEKMIIEVQKYTDKLDKNVKNEEFIQKCFMAILTTFYIPLMQNQEKGAIAISVVALSAIIYKIYNNISTSYNTRLSIYSNAQLLTVQMEYDKIIEQLKLNNFNLGNDFDKIENINYNILLENNNLKLYAKETKGYINNELFCQTSLFVNDIEFWHGPLKDSFLPVTYSRYCIYVFDEKVTFIPLEYVINSILSVNPIETLNELLEEDVKVYRR